MGTLVPPWYDAGKTTKGGLLVASFFFGASMAVAAFDSSKASRQCFRSWRRSNRANTYIAMIWAAIITCIITSICSFLFLMGKIRPRSVFTGWKDFSHYIANRAWHSLWYFVGMRRWQHRLMSVSPMLADTEV